jgi:hypothetical protein
MTGDCASAIATNDQVNTSTINATAPMSFRRRMGMVALPVEPRRLRRCCPDYMVRAVGGK